MHWSTLRREFDWRLQNALTLSPPQFKRPLRVAQRVTRHFSTAQAARLGDLAARYRLDAWPDHCTATEFRLNLYVLDVLDRHLPPVTGAGRALDIGAAGWGYLPALAAVTGGAWDGIELDAHRRYWTLTTRRAHADYMCRHHPGCRYLPGSLLDLDGAYNRITWFLPFVLPAALRAWRLPARFFAPEALLRHAWSILAPGGAMLVINQGEHEAVEQQRLFASLRIRAAALGEIHSVFGVFSQPRLGWLAAKPSA